MNPYVNLALPLSDSPWLYVYREWSLKGAEWIEAGTLRPPSCRVEMSDPILNQSLELECRLSYFMEDRLIATRIVSRSVSVKNNIISLKKAILDPIIIYKSPYNASYAAFKILIPWPIGLEIIEKNMQLTEPMLRYILSNATSEVKYFDWGIRGRGSTLISYGLLEGHPIFAIENPQSSKIFYNSKEVAMAALLRSRFMGVVGPALEEAFEESLQTTKFIDLEPKEQSAIFDLVVELKHKIEELQFKAKGSV